MPKLKKEAVFPILTAKDVFQIIRVLEYFWTVKELADEAEKIGHAIGRAIWKKKHSQKLHTL